MESFPSASGRTEAILKTACVALCLGILLSRPINRRIGETDHHASNRPQNPRRPESPYSAQILAQSDVQAMVQPTFHHPVASLEREHSLGMEFFQSQTAHQKDSFPRPFTLALDPCLQSGGQPCSGKADLNRRHFQALQKANLQASAVALPFQNSGFGRGLRGKNSVWRTEFRGSFAGLAGCP